MFDGRGVTATMYNAKHFEFLLKNLVAADHRKVEHERETSRREFGVCLT